MLVWVQTLEKKNIYKITYIQTSNPSPYHFKNSYYIGILSVNNANKAEHNVLTAPLALP